MSSPADRLPASAPVTDPAPLRFVTAASLFDGHDAAINIMRRLIQAQGAEVVHLGHNRAVEDVVRAALQEDADGIAVSSYQGGHMEYFRYMVDMLRERGAGHVRVFGGGGGTITPEEIAELQAAGVERIYHPNDGMAMGLVAMIEDLVRRTQAARQRRGLARFQMPALADELAIGTALSALEDGLVPEVELQHLRKTWQLAGGRTPVLGLTGTGGAGKSSVTDELLLRFLAAFPAMHIAVISVDPTRRRSGGALLGDRIRMNALRSPRVYMRSMATRRQHVATNATLKDSIALLRALGFDLVIVETAGIGQSDSEIVDLVDLPVYVMTSDYGAPSQLEKIDMLDYADLVVLNKFDRRGAEDALRDVRKQWKRNRNAFTLADDAVPVYPTIASQFNDPGVTWMFNNLCRIVHEKLKPEASPRIDWRPGLDTSLKEPRATVLIPGSRVRYLAEIAEQGRAINRRTETEAKVAARAQACWEALRELGDPLLPAPLALYPSEALIVAGDTPLPSWERGRGEGAIPASTALPSPQSGTREAANPAGATPLPSWERGRGEGAIPASNTPLPSPQSGTREAASPAGDTPLPSRERGTREAASPAGDTPLPSWERGRGEGAIPASTALPSRERGTREAASPAGDTPLPSWERGRGDGAIVDRSQLALRQRYNDAIQSLSAESLRALREWPARRDAVIADVNEYQVRGKAIRVENYRTSLSHQKIPKIAPPRTDRWGEQLRFLGRENLPGAYPYTGGVYPYRRTGEDPIRMFAGEGTPERTNRRFHYLSLGQPAARLSTAFDSVTLYGEDPHLRPDIYGKIGNSGVNIPTLDDMKKLYSGFDLCDPATSVSMTINGPAPIILAMFMNTAVDQQVEKWLLEDSSRWAEAERRIEAIYRDHPRPRYEGALPEGNEGLGLALLGVSGDEVVDRETYERIRAATLSTVRGTVQADILKEDQAQNTCIFSTEFALRMMGDIQQTFVERKVRNFYSVSISGYHIAEAGANPISQLAFTLSNGFTIVEYYLARGMKVDDFAPNLSFFFSNGMDPEYTVIGRVARRIWARAMRERYGANERSQMLKYHVQTSGRSLHAQEIQFNDIRTTLQALYALFDNCNSLHTNAYDEAITTPTEESVRRAVAIQMIINKELGLNFCENPWQGSHVVEYLTDLVEDAVYQEFEAISERGGVLGAMDTMYQRGKIQEESMYYERQKHDGTLPLVGVNTFLPKEHGGEVATTIELIRSTEDEKGQQIANVEAFRAARNLRVVGDQPGSLLHLQQVARARGNVFEALMEAVKHNSLGQISHALYAVGGEYRRNM